MKNKLMLIFLAFICGIIAGWWVGFEKGREFVYEQEFKVAEGNFRKLRSKKDEHEELYEYLKMRAYYFANFVPDSWLHKDLDQGPVELDKLLELSPGKDVFDNDRIYEKIQEKGR